MILTLSDSKENKLAALNLKNSHTLSAVPYIPGKMDLKAVTDKLILLDIDADDKLWNKIQPDQLAKDLLKANLPKTLNSVFLLNSDVNQQRNLREFGREFAQNLQEAGIQVSVFVPTDFNYELTLLVPPSQKNNNHWQVFGIDERPKQKSAKLADYLSIKSKKLIWDKVDIFSWLNDGQKKVTAQPLVDPSATFSL